MDGSLGTGLLTTLEKTKLILGGGVQAYLLGSQAMIKDWVLGQRERFLLGMRNQNEDEVTLLRLLCKQILFINVAIRHKT